MESGLTGTPPVAGFRMAIPILPGNLSVSVMGLQDGDALMRRNLVLIRGRKPSMSSGGINLSPMYG